ncbi:ABC transporter ATP-binding protein [Frondihabitans cladoniiphilus]|uniref:ABC transporter ATP-binding protein n=1 Tax=Frondihabitans cladoniiphilus TaxID=715785 RepID=A0ABP8W400_9MICO
MTDTLTPTVHSTGDVGDPRGAVLSIRDLVVEAGPRDAPIRLLDGVSIDVAPGEVVALVGESGSGKSMTMLATMGLLPAGVRVVSGSIRLGDRELRGATLNDLRSVRGKQLAMIFQDPMTSLNPVMRIGSQLAEMITLHDRQATREQVKARSIELLELVHMPDPERRLRAFPHELSGGQRQRVMIAMSIAHEPRMLIADEPTTALDVTVQAQVMSVLQEVRERLGSSLVLVTHDLGLVAQNADRVVVLYKGRIVEEGDVVDLYQRPQHDYTKKLLASILPINGPLHAAGVQAVVTEEVVKPAATGEPVITLEDVQVHYPQRTGLGRRAEPFVAVGGVSLELYAGRTLGLVGESGCGKSTLVRTILGMTKPTSGRVTYEGNPISTMNDRKRRPYRPAIQAVFQDPFSSLDPRMSVFDIVAEPLRINRKFTPGRVREVLDQVGLTPEMAKRRPTEFSGGQRQRVGIARALALKPQVLILDEPTSALDVSIQAQVITLLRDLQDELGLAYLFVSHDLSVVRNLSDDVAVMRRGLIVEKAPSHELFEAPTHEYTRQLLASVPDPDPTARTR